MQKSLVCPPALVDEALLVVDEASEGAGDGERGVLALEDEPAALRERGGGGGMAARRGEKVCSGPSSSFFSHVLTRSAQPG